MNIAQNCIQSAQRNKAKEVSPEIPNQNPTGTPQRPKVFIPPKKAVPEQKAQPQSKDVNKPSLNSSDKGSPKWTESPKKRYVVDLSPVIRISKIVAYWLMIIFVFVWAFYVALTYIAGGTTFANQRIQTLFEAPQEIKVVEVQAVQTAPENGIEGKSGDLNPSQPKTDPTISKDLVGSNETPGAPLPLGALPKLISKLPSSTEQPPKIQKSALRNQTDDRSEDGPDEQSPKIKLLKVDRTPQPPAVTLLSNQGQTSSAPFEVLTLTKQSVVIKTDQGTKQVAVGQSLPDGRVIESIDPSKNSYTSGGNKIQIQ